MEAMLSFIPAPIAIALMLLGFVALAVGGIRLGYKATVKDLALELVEKAERSIMGSGPNTVVMHEAVVNYLATASA